ncbi:MAG: pyridoxine 5-phosphate synthase [Chlorobi bacterium]|nr:pyridoxine 5-phosphate synthase [Chlorobiota bacterium]
MTKLSVNVNKVATLRNTRNLGIPGIVHASRLCLDAGAHGITVHPRPDARHIRPSDVYEVAAMLKEYPEAEYNIEGNPFPDYMEYARVLRPAQCTLVPDAHDAFTSNEGWNLEREGERLRPIIATLKSYGCRVSLFMDALTPHLEIAAELGADRIELYTEPYAAAFAQGNGAAEVERFAETAREAAKRGLGINAGHDLNLENLPLFAGSLPELLEVSIGHALIADALEFGLGDTVRRYRAALTVRG